MEKQMIFETKLKPENDDYSGFSFYLDLPNKDKAIVDNIATLFYDSTALQLKDTLHLSIGDVLIEGEIHPTADRRKLVRGYLIEDRKNRGIFNENKKEEGKELVTVGDQKEPSDDKQKELKSIFINYLNKLMEIQSSIGLSKQNDLNTVVRLIIEEIEKPETKLNINEMIICNLHVIKISNNLKKTSPLSQLVNFVRSKLNKN